MDDRLHDVIKIGLKLKGGRPQWLSLWEELAQIFLPTREGFVGETTPGEEKGHRNYTNRPQLSRRGLASALSALSRPAGKVWLKAVTRNRRMMMSPAVRSWCQAVTEITYDAIYHPSAHMEKQMSEADNDLVTFGTNAVKIGWNKDKGHLTYKTHHLKNIVLMTDEFGVVNAAWYFGKWPLRNIIEMFGEESLPENMKNALKQRPPQIDKEFEICHACVPNKQYEDEDSFRPGNKEEMRPPVMPYMSIWYATEDKKPLDVAGYWEFPYLCGRWDTQSQEIYGRSPAMVALDASRLANEIARDLADAGGNAVRPPLGAWGDFISGDIQLHSGGLTLFDSQGKYDRNGDPIWTIDTGVMPKEIFDLLQMQLEDIKASFFLHVFELPGAGDANMTATEINARYDEFLRNGSPTFARVETDYNAGHVNRVFNILQREGQYPPPPPELENQDIEFEYESPLKQLRKKAEAVKILEALSMQGELAAGLGPEKAQNYVDNFNEDAIARVMSENLDLPEILMVPFEQMMEMRAQRAEQQKMMAMAEMANKAAPALAAAGDLPQQLLGQGSPIAEGGALQAVDAPAMIDNVAGALGAEGQLPREEQQQDAA